MAEPDPAAAHFFAINLVRLGSALLVVAAILILSDKLALPEIAGYVILVLGLVGFFVVPVKLARRWSTREK